MEPSAGWFPSAQGSGSGEDHLGQYLDSVFYENVKYLASDFFRRWMVKEAARNNLGGEESTTFFNHPAVARVSAFINPSCVLAERYMFKLAAHAEIQTEDNGIQNAAAVTAMVIILAEHAPFSLVQSLSPETREVASNWIEEHCKIEGQKQP